MTMEDQVGSLSISRCSSTSSICEAFPASSKASMHCKVQMSIYLDLPDFSIPRYVLDMFSATFSVSKAPTGICLRACRPSWAPTSQRNDTVGHRSRRPARWEVDTATTSSTFREQGKSQIGTGMNRDEQGWTGTNMGKYGQMKHDNQWQSMTSNDKQCLIWLDPWVISSNIKVHASSQLGVVQKHLRGTWMQNQPKSATNRHPSSPSTRTKTRMKKNSPDTPNIAKPSLSSWSPTIYVAMQHDVIHPRSSTNLNLSIIWA